MAWSIAPSRATYVVLAPTRKRYPNIRHNGSTDDERREVYGRDAEIYDSI